MPVVMENYVSILAFIA